MSSGNRRATRDEGFPVGSWFKPNLLGWKSEGNLQRVIRGDRGNADADRCLLGETPAVCSHEIPQLRWVLVALVDSIRRA